MAVTKRDYYEVLGIGLDLLGEVIAKFLEEALAFGADLFVFDLGEFTQ